MTSRSLGLLAMAQLAVALPSAAATVFDITGSGQACIGAPDVSGSTCVAATFTGTVTIDIDPDVPPQINSDGNTAHYSNGAAVTTFQLSWPGGTYTSAHVPDPETDFTTGATVWNNVGNPPQDDLNVSWYSGQYIPDQTGSNTTWQLNYAHLVRTADATWLSGLPSPETVGLATGPNAVNWVRYVVYRADCGVGYQGVPYCDYVGYYGDFYLDTMVARRSIPDSLQELLLDVSGIGPGKSLADKVVLAQAYFAAADTQATCAVLEDFVHEVGAQSGKKLALGLAETLTGDARKIMQAIGCN